MEGTTDRLAGLSPEKRELLESMLRKRRAEAASLANIVPRGSFAGALPLSFSQERLWLIDQLEPRSPAYHIPQAVRLTGELSPGLLRRIFAEIARRHEALRTTFEAHDGLPVQVVAPADSAAARPEMPIVDLSALPEAEREARTLEAFRQEIQRPFALHTGPLLRLCLARQDERRHVLLVNMHHIISDGWSLGVLLREIAALFAAYSKGLPSPLPELPAQYPDFALWQRRWLQGEVLATQVGWWKRELSGAPGTLALPTDRPRSPFQSRAGGFLPLTVPSDVTAGIRELCLRHRITPFMLLLAVFQALLHRLSGQEDVLVGSPVANRQRIETEGLIGFFVNTLVLRGRFASRDLTFDNLLEQTRGTVIDAFDHQDLPFERLVVEIAPERDPGVSPLFQVLFSVQTTPPRTLPQPGLTLEPVAVHTGQAQFDLSLDLIEHGGGLQGGMEFSRALFDESTARRLLTSFTELLRGAVAAPERRIAELPLLDQGQRHQIVREWNESGGMPERVSILPLFERRAALAPDATALSQQGRPAITYGDLDRRANQLAHRLRRLGIGAETPVAVLAERSPELIVAFLGILKTGGAYVPLDPAYPRERLDFMLESSGAPVLLTLERHAGDFSKGPATVLLDVDRFDNEPDAPPSSHLQGGQLAYVLYTSGSTGRPKGVMVSHGALARYAEAVRAAYAVGPGDRVMQFCSISFDTSLEEIVPCLTGGAELVLRTDEILVSVATFLEACRAQGVTVLSLPTAYWHEIAAKVESEGLALPSCLRLVIIGGERALVERVTAWRWQAPERPRLINSYGVTESTILSTLVDVAAPSTAEARGEVSIGRVLPGSEAYLFDREMEPAPIGAAGELYLGGGQLARGYLGRPDLTAERFVPHPCPSPSEPGARLYRTGDLARALPNGELEFAGRSDRQIKVRGYRIEIEEIEARLLRHPEIESAVVVVREDQRGEKLVVAYWVPRETPGPAPAGLREFLREALPDYMVPGAYVALPALPLTPNGKLDRRALPAPDSTIGDDQGYVPPSDRIEQVLAGIWAEALGRDRVGIRDDFFVLGGHSLLATQVVSRIRGALGTELPLASLLRHPTVERLAAVLRESAVPLPRSPLVELCPGSGRPLFLVHPAGGEVLCYVPLARRLADRHAVYGLQAADPEPGATGPSVEEMADLYLMHLRKAQPEGPYLLGGWSLGGAVAFEMARQLERRGETVERVLLIDAFPPGHLWREEAGDGALVASFAFDLGRMGGIQGITGIALPADFGQWPPSDALGWLAARAEEAGILASGLGAGELERRFAVFRANHQALAGYTGGTCAAPLLLVRAAEPVPPEPDLGWGRLTGQPGQPVEVHVLPGDHYGLLREPEVERLASLLRERLGQAGDSRSSTTIRSSQV